MDYRLNSDVKWDVRLPAMVPRDIAGVWKDAADEAAKMPGNIWSAILGLQLTAAAREIFERAHGLAGWDFVLPPEVLFEARRLPIECSLVTRSERLTFVIETRQQARDLRGVLSGEWQTASANRDVRTLAGDFIDAGLLTPEPEHPPRFTEPGIYRLTNSAVVFRSERACIAVDPDFVEGRWLGGHDIAMLDAIVISHSHSDHFSYLTLLQFPHDLTIIVPEVEKQSILSDDMAGLLRDAGFTKVIVAQWYTNHTIKDITIHALPFYGEQPWLSFGSPDAALRNCGNTYVVETPAARTWLLVDSGSEHGHSMLDVADDARKFGTIDVVMSGVFEVRWHPGSIDSFGGQWWCFPVAKLNAPETWPNNQLMKLHHPEINRLLATLKAGHFFPYTTPSYLAGHRSESEQLDRIEAAGPLTTELHAWQIGDRIEIRNGRAAVHSGSGSRLLLR